MIRRHGSYLDTRLPVPSGFARQTAEEGASPLGVGVDADGARPVIAARRYLGQYGRAGARASWILESELDAPANVERAQPRE